MKMKVLQIRNLLVIAALVACVISSVGKAFPKSLQNRTVMVQLFEWPWEDVAKECETYLGPAGFSAVQISPPQEHAVTGQNFWWERYQPVSYLLESRSGTKLQLQNMIKRCQKAGVDIYVDIVINHTAAIDTHPGFAGTQFKKYEHSMYQFQDYNHCGRNGNDYIVNYMDRYEVQNCELLGLADLKTGSDYVQGAIAQYIRQFIQMGAKGFRIDAAKHIPAADLQRIISKVGLPTYYISETFIGVDEPIALDEYIEFSDVNVFQFSFQIGTLFRENKIQYLAHAFLKGYPKSSDAVVFLENHDLQRMGSNAIVSYATTRDEYMLANVFMLTWPYGYPQVFSGYSFQDYNQGPPVDQRGYVRPVLDQQSLKCQIEWLCEHRLPWIQNLVTFRNLTNSFFAASKIWAEGNNQFAFSRGNLGFVAINNSTDRLDKQIATDLPDGDYCNILELSLGSVDCKNKWKVQNGLTDVRLAGKSAVVLMNLNRVKSTRRLKPQQSEQTIFKGL